MKLDKIKEIPLREFTLQLHERNIQVKVIIAINNQIQSIKGGGAGQHTEICSLKRDNYKEPYKKAKTLQERATQNQQAINAYRHTKPSH